MADETVPNGATPTAAPLTAKQSTTEQWSVASVLTTIPGGPPTPNTPSPVPYFHLLERLKTTKREGWKRFGLAHGESISDHMYRMSMITMLAPPSLSSKLNVPHCMKMALIHDMAEALVGDITPVDGVSKTEKSRRESTTMDYISNELLGKVNGGVTGEEIKQIWQEYEDSKTLDAVFVHDVDKLELVLQMVEYEKREGGKLDLGEFSWVASKIQLPEVKQWCDDVLDERDAFWKENGGEHTSYPRGKMISARGVEAEKIRQKEEYYGNGTKK